MVYQSRRISYGTVWNQAIFACLPVLMIAWLIRILRARAPELASERHTKDEMHHRMTN